MTELKMRPSEELQEFKMRPSEELQEWRLSNRSWSKNDYHGMG